MELLGSIRAERDAARLLRLELGRARDDKQRLVADFGRVRQQLLQEVAERRNAEAQLRQSEARLRLAVRAGGVGIWVWDVETNRLEWDDQMFALYGARREEFGGAVEAWRAHLHPDDLARSDREVEAALRGEAEFDTEFRVLWGDGEVHTLRAIATVLRDPSGRPLRMTGTNWDITRQKQDEAEKGRLQAELLQAQKMESVGRLAGGVAHDFNNMLGVILGHVELAADQVELTHPLYSDLQEIRDAARRSAALTKQLLAFARKQTVQPRVLDLNETIGGMHKMLERLIGENISLVWAPGPSLWKVWVDPSQVDQLLANLCVNARDAIAVRGRIIVETANRTLDGSWAAEHPRCGPGEYVMISVKDTGRGIPQGALPHLFEPFFTTKEIGKGTGLGLATVYGIVQQNGGAIEVESEVGRGTTFRIFLPRRPAEAAAGHQEALAGPPGCGHETILLVEDEEGVRRVADRILRSLGYLVLNAASPQEAIGLAQGHPGQIQLLLTDVVMPDMNGRDLAHRIQDFRPGIRSLFMSGYPAEVIARQGVLEPGFQFLQKPFTREQLGEGVRKALEG